MRFEWYKINFNNVNWKVETANEKFIFVKILPLFYVSKSQTNIGNYFLMKKSLGNILKTE